MKRIITAIVLIALMVPCIILGGWWMFAFTTALFGCGIYELLKTGKGQNWSIAVYIVTIGFSTMIYLWCFFISYLEGSAEFLTIPVIEGKQFIRVSIVLVVAFLISLLVVECLSANININAAFYLFTVSLMISISCQALFFIRDVKGIQAIVYIVGCSWLTDFGGHIIGTKFGKHKLSSVSPKKTIEGAIGGVALTTIFGGLFYCFFPFVKIPFDKPIMFFVSFLLGLGGVIGDLVFSSIKRQSGIKDFSEVLPGHGGVLDRFDSVIFNALLFLAIHAVLTEGLLR